MVTALDSQEAFLPTCLTLDVFLSFRGTDVRKTFVDHLYAAFCRAGFRTFKDDYGIDPGKDIGRELGRAIRESRVSVIVFSKNYASSAWCLDELLLILKCRTYGHEVVPVFYDVQPHEVKKQTGSFEEAFAVHEEKEALMDKVGRWRAALTEVGGLFGMHLQNQANGYEAKFIEDITKEVGDKLRGMRGLGYRYQCSVVKYRILALLVESMILFSSPLNSWKPSSGLVKINCDVSPSDELLKILALDVQSVFVASGQVSLHRFATNSLFPASPTYQSEL